MFMCVFASFHIFSLYIIWMAWFYLQIACHCIGGRNIGECCTLAVYIPALIAWSLCVCVNDKIYMNKQKTYIKHRWETNEQDTKNATTKATLFGFKQLQLNSICNLYSKKKTKTRKNNWQLRYSMYYIIYNFDNIFFFTFSFCFPVCIHLMHLLMRLVFLFIFQLSNIFSRYTSSFLATFQEWRAKHWEMMRQKYRICTNENICNVRVCYVFMNDGCLCIVNHCNLQSVIFYWQSLVRTMLRRNRNWNVDSINQSANTHTHTLSVSQTKSGFV